MGREACFGVFGNEETHREHVNEVVEEGHSVLLLAGDICVSLMADRLTGRRCVTDKDRGLLRAAVRLRCLFREITWGRT